jgi:carbonic anhydrase/acetyltransferase-like protein (isoleucine patch superfamily)
VTLHGCTIGHRVLIGMGAIILDDAEIGDDCIIGAGSLVTKNTKVPPRSLVYGSPARVVRPLNDEELAFLPKSAANYVGDLADYYGVIPGPTRAGKGSSDVDLIAVRFAEALDDSFDGGNP